MSPLLEAQTAWAVETRSDAGFKMDSFEARAGREVSRTKDRPDTGSAQASVPVDPLWPKVCDEQFLPNVAGLRSNPRPRRRLKPWL